MKPRVAIVLGDPCGIGPELVVKLLADANNRDRADMLVIGDHRILREGESVVGCSINVTQVNTFEDAKFDDGVPVVLNNLPLDPQMVPVGDTSKTTGRWQLDCLSTALRLASDGRIDGFCFAPLNKEAMHLGGLAHEDELGFFVEEIGHHGPTGILNTLGDLWTSRVTSHVPHKAVSDLITHDTVIEAIRIADSGLRLAGYDAPRLAVAGLNPHAGDGGNFGQEEIDVIIPAVEVGRAEGIAVDGPFPADTIFLKARDKEYDAIVTMYHDQGQVAMKLMGFDHGVSVHAGIPFPITTPAHGSAFDIAGENKANPAALQAAFTLLCRMAERGKKAA